MGEAEQVADCPRCQGALVLQDVFRGGRHATVAGCVRCGGHWMRDSDLQRLSEVVVPVLAEWRSLGSQVEQGAPLRCPECPGAPAMEKLRSERDDRVVLDRCGACAGIWLDANELRAIQEESLMALVAGLAQRPLAR
jgi:Zn-finger nucleic acid-binding protein